MIAMVFALIGLFIAGGIGRTVLRRCALFSEARAEQWAFAAAIGFGIIGYGVYFMGLIGHGLLSKVAIGVWLLVIGAVSFRGAVEQVRDISLGIRAFAKIEMKSERVVVVFCFLVLLFFGFVSLLACYMAPTGQAWDAVSYHLADPKVFLRQGQITVLPTEHHSNFPFLMEMLFLVGLLFGDFPLANLFHWLMGLLCVVTLVGFGQRRIGNTAGWIGAVLFVTTPVALWQASIAYIDIALGVYTLLGSIAAVEVVLASEEKPRKQWSVIAGSMLGFALGIKYLALLPFAFIVCLLVLKRVPFRCVAMYLVVGGMIASPWYIKNTVLMGNPVYPYMYKVFPNSKYWSAERGRVYDSEQQGFGYAHSLRQPAETVQNLMLSPWRVYGNAERFSNQGEYTFMALFGGLWAGLLFAGLLLRGVPLGVKLLTSLGVLQLFAWFFVAQVSRYLVFVLPLLAVGCGYVVHRMLFEKQKSGRVAWLQPILVVGAVGGQVALMCVGLFLLPTNGRTAMENGTQPTVVNVLDMLAEFSHSSATSPRLTRSLEYPAINWLNMNTDKDAGVVLYEETRGYYLDRPYLWGNGEHSSYIPYDTFSDSAGMSAWFRGQGFRYALVNLNWSSKKGDPEMPSAPIHLEREALRRWYVDTAETTGWRGLVADALRRDLWRVVYADRGVVILEIGQ